MATQPSPSEITSFRYWIPYHTQEHLLLPYEIAAMWGLFSSTRKHHTSLVSAILKRYCTLNNIDAVYFLNKFGYLRVYSCDVINAAWRWFLELGNHTEGRICIGNKIYRYMIVARQENT